MGRNLDIALQIYRRGTVVLIPDVRFPTGVIKSKYAVLLEGHEAFYKCGEIRACFTTSKQHQFQPWHVITSAQIFGRAGEEITTIDCLNRICLKEDQLKKCIYKGVLKEDILEELDEAEGFADFFLENNPGFSAYINS